MKPVFILALGLFAVTLLSCIDKGAWAKEKANGFALSDMRVRITSNGHTATFRLYDTTAAKQFYDQLPLGLDLSNFRDAQWMFYPPKKLAVTSSEAYHDGKKGELSYYEPWGDAFMLYTDFYAGDEMHRLGVNESGIEEIAQMSGKAKIEKNDASRKIHVTANGKTTVFELNKSAAADSLYEQLPLTIKVENYSNDEKIFYPPKKLETQGTPLANAKAGTLAYFAPWGDVVMFYAPFGSYSGLYELGQAVEGAQLIKGMTGTIEITK